MWISRSELRVFMGGPSARTERGPQDDKEFDGNRKAANELAASI